MPLKTSGRSRDANTESAHARVTRCLIIASGMVQPEPRQLLRQHQVKLFRRDEMRAGEADIEVCRKISRAIDVAT